MSKQDQTATKVENVIILMELDLLGFFTIRSIAYLDVIQMRQVFVNK